jgi:uncharacterized protein involved in exopolysaccharide biosynthesis
MQEGSVDLRPFFTFVWKAKLPIALVGLLLAGLNLLVTIVSPAVWRASVVILLPLPTGGGSISSASSILGSDADPLAILQGIIQSYPAQKYVSEKTGLSMGEVMSKIAVTTDGPKQQVMISYDDTRKKFGLGVVQSTLDVLTELSGKTDVSQAATQAKYYEAAVKQKAKDLKTAEDKVLAFQQSTITAPDPSSPFSGSGYTRRLRDLEFDLKSTVQQIEVAKKEAEKQGKSSVDVPTAMQSSIRWRSRIVELQYNLSVAETKLGPLAPEVVALRKQIDVTRQRLQNEITKELTSINKNLDPAVALLESKRLLLEYQREYLVKMSNIAPREAVDFQRLVREALAQADLYKDIRTRYETARIQAQVERAKWSVLAEPYIQPGPTNKAYVRNTLLGFLVGIVGAAAFFFRRYAKDQRTSLPVEA